MKRSTFFGDAVYYVPGAGVTELHLAPADVGEKRWITIGATSTFKVRVPFARSKAGDDRSLAAIQRNFGWPLYAIENPTGSGIAVVVMTQNGSNRVATLSAGQVALVGLVGLGASPNEWEGQWIADVRAVA